MNVKMDLNIHNKKKITSDLSLYYIELYTLPISTKISGLLWLTLLVFKNFIESHNTNQSIYNYNSIGS